MLQQIEQSIIKKIQSILEDSAVRLAPFPDAPKDFGRPNPSGQVLVGYKRSSFRVTGKQPMTLEQLAEFELSIQVKNLRTHTGAYTILDRIRFGLIGFIPMVGATDGMYPTAEGFADLDEGSWYYTQTFVVPLMLIEGTEDSYEPLPEDEPPINITEIRGAVWRSPTDKLPSTGSAQLDRLFHVEE